MTLLEGQLSDALQQLRAKAKSLRIQMTEGRIPLVEMVRLESSINSALELCREAWRAEMEPADIEAEKFDLFREDA